MSQSDLIVYLVDDDNDDLELLKEAFSDKKCTSDIKCFNTSTKVIPQLNNVNLKQLPDLIVLDHQLAVTGDIDLIRIVRAQEKYNIITLVVYSSSLQPSKIAMLLQKGADLCLEKGNCFDEIKAHIANFCEAVRKRQALFA
jgi:CheY-like chemotaxis protein